jgi:hypothetical protein
VVRQGKGKGFRAEQKPAERNSGLLFAASCRKLEINRRSRLFSGEREPLPEEKKCGCAGLFSVLRRMRKTAGWKPALPLLSICRVLCATSWN